MDSFYFVERFSKEDLFLQELKQALGDDFSLPEAYEFAGWCRAKMDKLVMDDQGYWMAFWEFFQPEDLDFLKKVFRDLHGR